MKRLHRRFTTKDNDPLEGAYNLERALGFNQDAVKNRYERLFVKYGVMTIPSTRWEEKAGNKAEETTSGMAGFIMLHILLPVCPAKRGEVMGREPLTWSHCWH